MIVSANATDATNTTYAIEMAASQLRAGNVIGLPTETVYGLGADACNDIAVAKIYAIKGRPVDHPVIVHIASHEGGLSGARYFASEIPAFAQDLMAAFWPGPLTLILPREPKVADVSACHQPTIGLRCPSHPVCQELLLFLLQSNERNKPIYGISAPSANRFGRISPTTAEHVHSDLGDDIFILDAGPCSVGIESTIVDCSRGYPMLLRPGIIHREQIASVCAVMDHQAFDAITSATPKFSGSLPSHYAPQKTLLLLDAPSMLTRLKEATTSTRRLAIYARDANVLAIAKQHDHITVVQPDDPAQMAHDLFAILRMLDGSAAQEIWVESLVQAPSWEGLTDRLKRASFRPSSFSR